MIYIIFLSFIVAILWFAFYQWQYFMVFSPTHYRDGELGNEFEKLSVFCEDGTELEGVAYSPEKPQATLLYFGGRSQDSVEFIKKLSKCFPTKQIITFNYRSYGKSGGSLTEKNIMEDALHVAKKIQKNYGDFYIVGFSLGSSVASYIASKHKVKGVFLVGVYDSVAGIAKRKFGINISLLLRYKFNNTKVVKNINSPTYVFVSKNDQTTYIENARELKKYYKNLTFYKEFENITHKDLICYDDVVKKIDEITIHTF